MGVGEEQSLLIEDHPASLTALHPRTGHGHVRHAEETTEHGVRHQPARQAGYARTADGAGSLQRHHGCSTALHSSSHEGFPRERSRCRPGLCPLLSCDELLGSDTANQQTASDDRTKEGTARDPARESHEQG